ncbi:MAG TPA: transglutaminase family protein [Dissulfurispiraceae bacterium]|nr:transglutaminase family protein [Dissulfurispiraceae bacterium]
MRYLIEHETTLEYQEPVFEHQIELRLTPRETHFQKLNMIEISSEPVAELRGHFDYFGNKVDAFEVIPPHRRIVTRVRAEVENILENPFSFQPLPYTEERDWIRKELRERPEIFDFVLSRSSSTPCLGELDQALDFPRHQANRSILESVQEAMRWIGETVEYRSGVTCVHSSLDMAINARAGVCQDFAHLLIAIVRSWKIPARYVMGYLAPQYGAAENLPEATHAWAEVLIPGNGWTGFDATQQILTNEYFIPVAIGRDSHDAAPQRGSYKGDAQGKEPEVRLSVSQQ